MNIRNITRSDQKLAHFMKLEEKRQIEGLEMIPSENYVSSSVLEAMGSILTNKYSEGFPKKRYYGGNEYIDEIEMLAMSRAQKLFGVPHVNVQPYSGSPANLAVYLATCKPGDTVMGLDLTHGGHLTHGWNVSATGIFYNPVLYHVDKTGQIDFTELEMLIKKHKPKLIWVGATAYVYEFPFRKFADLAATYGAYLAADIAHVAGLVVAKVHLSPVSYAHIVTTTTHKTLRGPRGAMIMVTKKGLQKDADLADRIDKAVFPGLQGGPHDHTTAAIAIALREAQTPAFRKYGKQIVINAKTLAASLLKRGIKLVGNGTQNHMLLVDLIPLYGSGGGYFAQYALEVAGITVNKNTIPGEPSSPFYPSGIRLGTPALTTRGLKAKDMIKVADWISRSLEAVRLFSLPSKREERKPYMDNFKKKVHRDRTLLKIRREVRLFASKFPIFKM